MRKPVSKRRQKKVESLSSSISFNELEVSKQLEISLPLDEYKKNTEYLLSEKKLELESLISIHNLEKKELFAEMSIRLEQKDKKHQSDICAITAEHNTKINSLKEESQIKADTLILNKKLEIDSIIHGYQEKLKEQDEKNLIEFKKVNNKTQDALDKVKHLENKCRDLDSRLNEAQIIRANHWNKYEVEKIKNSLLSEKIVSQNSILTKYENSLSWTLGNIIIKFFNKKISLETMLALTIDQYVEYKNKISDGGNIGIDDFVNNYVRSQLNNYRFLDVKNHAIGKVFGKYTQKIVDEFLRKVKSEIQGNKKKLDLPKTTELISGDSFFSMVENKAIKSNLENKKNIKKLKKNVVESKPLRELKKLKVAVIFDEFTYECFKYEFDAYILEPNNWRKVFEENDIDLFFCESAWSGVDSVKRPWKGQVYASKNFAKENRTEILNILEHCKQCNIPSLFWNKEDPTHYPDDIHSFTKTAILFDHVFTVAEECIEKYKKDFGLKSVHLLPFATQPKMFNPIETSTRTDDVVFAGSWYANHEERSRDMQTIFDNVLESNHKLKIYDRFYGSDDPNHIFPDEYKVFSNPAVAFSEINKVYKESSMSLTMNTVKDSKSMIARRAFELMSCNTLVLSNYADGMYSLFPKMFIDIETCPEQLSTLNSSEINLIRKNALHNVLKNHTYKVRWENIVKEISYQFVECKEEVTCVFKVNSIKEIEKVIADYELKSNVEVKLMFILNESNGVNQLLNALFEYNNEKVTCMVESYFIRYSENISEKIATPYTAIFETNNESWIESLEAAIIHLEYIEDKIVMLDQGNVFHLYEHGKMENILFSTDKFYDVYHCLNKDVVGDFYSLNVVGFKV